ncbi:PadR family transcriptional regulator [Christensenellaceae bacterium OttesenSCG-928-M15]|nr:PadR family transcriptional regulator [Christensenellaceae bacterium OttesenSCG-928-M15]
MARKKLETLSEQMFYILLALHKPRHGYGIMQYIKELTKGRVQVGAATIYTLLARFEKDGYISLIDEQGGKKGYCITQSGKALFQQEQKRLEQLLLDCNTNSHKSNSLSANE